MIKILIAAIVVEAIIEYFGSFLNKGFHFKQLFSLTFGMIFAVIYRIDLLGVVGLHTDVPFVGMVLSGILLSRGSNYIADLMKKLGAKG